MSLLSPPDQERLRDAFSGMTRPVRLLFFTQTLGCDTCRETQQILAELPPLSDNISVEEVNLVLEPDRARAYGIERVPAIAILFAPPGAAEAGDREASTDSRMRFLGAPSGYEFVSLVSAILLAGGGESALTPENRSRIAAHQQPVTMQVFTTPTCPHCPRAVALAHEMAFANPNITATAVEATEFPDLARRYLVSGVPKTVVNDRIEILGALPQDDFVQQALES